MQSRFRRRVSRIIVSGLEYASNRFRCREEISGTIAPSRLIGIWECDSSSNPGDFLSDFYARVGVDSAAVGS
jgi:hypothetical protein